MSISIASVVRISSHSVFAVVAFVVVVVAAAAVVVVVLRQPLLVEA